MGTDSDYIVTGTAADGGIRAFAATTRGLCEEARIAHNTSPVATAALGRLLTAGAMMGCMLKNKEDLLTLQIESEGPIRGLTVTADAESNVKGFVKVPDVMLPPNAKGKLDVGGAVGRGVISVIKDLGLKEPYVGQVELQTGEIAEDLTYYFSVSEQTPSAVALGVLMERNNTVKRAGGFILQLMPNAGKDVIDALEERLSSLSSVTTMLDQDMKPEDILNLVLKDMDFEPLERRSTGFHCNCSVERIEKVLFSIGEKELKEMSEEGKPIEVKCHFCNKAYPFEVTELQRILEEGRR